MFSWIPSISRDSILWRTKSYKKTTEFHSQPSTEVWVQLSTIWQTSPTSPQRDGIVGNQYQNGTLVPTFHIRQFSLIKKSFTINQIFPNFFFTSFLGSNQLFTGQTCIFFTINCGWIQFFQRHWISWVSQGILIPRQTRKLLQPFANPRFLLMDNITPVNLINWYPMIYRCYRCLIMFCFPSILNWFSQHIFSINQR